MKLTFLGATGTVTGSKYLIQSGNQKILVDCGLFQGYKDLRLRNWGELPIDPKSITMVVLTHAHIDHTGYLPLLVKNGFSGPIYATEATIDLCSILLPDCGYIQEEDAKRANKYHYTKHQLALPLYTKADAEIALKQFKAVAYGKPYAFIKEGYITWYRAGHILGSSFVQFDVNNVKTLFSGDIGRLHDPIMKPPSMIQVLDYLILESTYGDRLHDKTDPKEKIARVINETVKRGGTILIPAFAVGRAQSLLYYLFLLKNEKRIPDVPIFLDSPMAINATEILCRHDSEHQLSHQQCRLMCNAGTYTNTVDESKAIYQKLMPKIIISASGMATGGRVLHHLKMLASDPHNTILFTGYQAGGTRGDRILKGERKIKLLGEIISIKAHVESLTNTSAHADYEEILTWLTQLQKPPRKVFITHGEPEAASSLKQHIEAQFGWTCIIPKYLDQVELL